MDPAFDKFTGSPERGNLPLRPVSPSRENRLPTSPSLPSISPTRDHPERFAPSHTRGGSDVQNKVAAFNNLTKEAAQRKRDNEAALKRAVLGREEAESETRRLKEESDALRRDVEEGRRRERKVGERLESVMEEFQRAKENQAHLQTVYEKEVRRARKEAFKSSSALVNLQEELKTARNRYTLMRVEAEDERQRSTAKEQEISAAQQRLVMMEEELTALRQQSLNGKESDDSSVQQELEAVREELNIAKQQEMPPGVHDSRNVQSELREVSEELFVLKQKLSKAERKIERAEMQKQVVEEERDALKKSMEEDQLANCATQGAIALPPPLEGAGATCGSPRMGSPNDVEQTKSDRRQTEGLLEEVEAGDGVLQLRHELRREKRMRLEAEELVHLSLMECQFGCCSCRVAEKQGRVFVHDGSFAQKIAELAAGNNSKGNVIPPRVTIPEKPRSHQGPSRSATPKLAMPQRPQSQQALGRQATPKLLERPHSQQAESRRIIPRQQLHRRSHTETTFKTARDLDLQARRSISQARNPSATPPPPPTSLQFPEALDDTVLKAKNSDKQAAADNEEILKINFSFPYPQPLMEEEAATHPMLPPTSPEGKQPPSPTMDFSFTEIIPNIPSIPRPLPTPTTPPPPPATNDLTSSQPLTDQEHNPMSMIASTTTRIPTKDNNTSELFSPAAPDTPGGISREEALEQIRARRGRARSYAASASASHGPPTPKKGIWGTPRREISAPAIRRL